MDRRIVSAYGTKFGRMYCGKAEEVLEKWPPSHYKGRVQLIFTSPPFPLNRKKKYGNLVGEQYVEWIASFASILKEFLTEDGSIVVEIGNAWVKGKPVMSTLPIKALLAFQEKAELHLCQEFICFNPAKLPTPAQWVNVERIRVKDAFTRVWWMSANEKPKANNKRVLTQYSESMKDLLKKGTYNSGKRPSEHKIGAKSFLTDHGGAIPPNVLTPAMEEMIPELIEVLPIANTSSTDPFLTYCRENNITPHPARMPAKLVEFFVDFLTDPGDMVLDPFAGSNTTGYVAESKKRKWIGIEVKPDYIDASKVRFDLSFRQSVF
ncbi:MAG: site-specific DNA-methyltransferase [Desulfobacterales bacterium]|nr:site-specific DNA-methyltransferase [Desulfobacterales bacterium]